MRQRARQPQLQPLLVGVDADGLVPPRLVGPAVGGVGNRLAQLGEPAPTTAHRHSTCGQPPLDLIQPAAQLLQAALLLEPLRLAVVPPYSAAATTPRLPHGDRQTRPQALDRAA